MVVSLEIFERKIGLMLIYNSENDVVSLQYVCKVKNVLILSQLF